MKTFKTLIAPVIIAALAVTGVTAAQARADTNDVAKIVIGAVAIAAVANAINNSNHKSDSKALTVTSNDRTYAGRVVDNRYRYDRYHRDEGRKLREASNRCLLTYRARHGDRRLYDNRCLTRTTRALGNPPRQCMVRVVMRHGKNAAAYDPRCLDRAGFWNPRPQRQDRYGNHGTGQYQGDRRHGQILYGN